MPCFCFHRCGSWRSALPAIALGFALFSGSAHAALSSLSTAPSAGTVTITLRSSTNANGSLTVLQGLVACGNASQTQAGQDNAGAAAYRNGSLTLVAGMDAQYTVRNVVQSSSYTACATDGVDTLRATFITAAMKSFSPATWKPVGSVGFSVGTATFQSLSFSPDGEPYVAYQDSANGDRTSVMRFNSAAVPPAWVNVGTAGFSSAIARDQSLAFAPDGTPYVAYSDGGSSYFTTVMRYNGAAWITVGNAGFSAGEAYYQSLAFAPDGSPYVAYADGGAGFKLTVMRYNGTAWVNVGSPAFSAGAAYFQSLAFAPDGSPYVAYEDEGNGKTTSVMRYDGAAWAAVGSPGFSAGEAYYQSLSFAPDGTPYVAYQDSNSGFKTTVKQFDGAIWTDVGGAGVSSGPTTTQSLAFAPDGAPYVAYQDSTASKPTVLRFNGTAWLTIGGAEIAASKAYAPSLSFSPEGIPFVAYQDETVGFKTTVVRVAGVASAPTAVTAVAGNGQVTVRFAPGNNNGSAVTSYTVTAVPGGATCTAAPPATACTVTGLSNGTAYTFRVVATNTLGASAASAASSPVAPSLAAGPASIPTLSAWGLALTSALVALLAGTRFKRRRRRA